MRVNINEDYLFYLLHFSEFKTAFIRYFKYDSLNDVDGETQCLKLKWENAANRWQLADINTILKIVHVVPMFQYPENTREDQNTFLLNKYIWK